MTALLSVAEAFERIMALMQPVGREVVPLERAVGRVLAEPVIARRTQPPFAASAMDGYALRGSEVQAGARFTIVGESAAGHPFKGAVPEGCALRIFTGAPLPDGLDRIIIQEDVTRSGDEITLNEGYDTARYVRAAGLDFSEGEVLLPAPKRLTPEDIALAGAGGAAMLRCYRKPRVALLATGDELALPGEPTPPGHIVSSNNFGLAALIRQANAEPLLLPIAKDNEAALAQAAQDAQGADLFITLGGASVGDHDLIRPVLAKYGLNLDLYKLAMRPGKPLMAGKLGAIPMIGLPGNPVSAMVCGRLFLLPALEALTALPAALPQQQSARLTIDLGANGPREHYMRAHVAFENGAWQCTPFDSQDSSRLRLLSQANALAVRPPHDAPRAAGEPINFIAL